jgi:HPt (histidine-containing phosphotransfer) domain-containing protein
VPDSTNPSPEPDHDRGALDALDPGALDALEELAEGTSHDLIGELVEAFTEHAASTLQRIHDSLAGNRLDQVAKAAHELKGSAVTFGAGTLVSLCQTIENRAGRHDRAELESLVGRLRGELGRVQQALEEQIASRQSR